MRKAVKKTKTTKLILLAGMSSLLLVMSACSSTQVLQDNGDIPAPSLNPPENANQLASPGQVEESLPVSTETVQLSSPVTQTAPVSQVKYTAKKGDSLWKVAKMFDVSVNELAAFNNVDPKSSLKVGQSLQIPPAGLAVPKAISTPVSSDKAAKSTTKSNDKPSSSVSGAAYTVKSGDSLWTIAKKHHISTKKLAEANGLNDKASLKVGQKLIIPGAKASTAKSATPAADKKATKVEAAPAVKPASQSSNKMNDLINQTSQDTTSADKASSVPAVQTPSTPAVAQSTPSVASTAAVAPAPTANYLPHTVKDGDTWQTISDMYGVSIEDLKKVNSSIAGDAQPKSGTVVNIPEE